MLNPFFLNGSQQEQSLVQDLINEQLRMYGVEVHYLPRQYVTKNTVIREVIESKFTKTFPIEAYVNNFDGYGDNTQLLSKFGIQATNEINLVISQERFETYISPLIKDLANVELSTRPKEGDLIYFPLGDRLFEIKFVEHEKPFYMLQKNYTYELRCELFRYEDEVIDTGVEVIDDETDVIGNIRTLTLVSAGTAATATATVSGICTNGGVISVTMTSRGEKYIIPPTVKFSVSPTGSSDTAVGIATLISDLTNCDGTQIGSKVQGVELTNPGCGYTVAPGIAFIGFSTDPGVGAAATVAIGNGVLKPISITDGGGGYVTAPAVTISSPGIGTTALATAVVSSAGTISGIRFTNAGAGYTVAPTVTIAAPAGIGATVGVGTFVRNEIVTGYTSGATARVKTWTVGTGLLTISNLTADFTPGEVLYGSESNAVYRLSSVENDNTVEAFPDNDTIEDLADSILDFSEKNPFGTP